MNVWDASALLAFLLGEDGADLVESRLAHPAACSAANWSEVAQKVLARHRNWPAASALLTGMGLVVEPVTRADAEYAAALWQAHPDLSLADRLCLATGHRLGAEIWTADRAWGAEAGIRQIR